SSPVFRFYADAALTTELANLSVSPTVTTSYYVTVAGDGVCENSPGQAAVLTVDVNTAATAADINVSDLTICEGESVVLSALSGTVSSPVFRFYADAALTTELANLSVSPTVTTSYYVTVAGDGVCENAPGQAAVLTVNVNATAAPVIANPNQSFCASSAPALASISVEGEGIVWYASEIGGIPLAASTILENGKSYFAARVDSDTNCESKDRARVTVSLVNCDAGEGLLVVKAAESATVTAGETFTYSIAVVNTNSTPISNVTVTDVLDAKLRYENSSNSGQFASGAVVWNIPSVPANSALDLTVWVSTSSDLAPGTQISNVAVASSPDDPEGPKESDPAVVTVEKAANLTITKTAGSPTVLAGGNLEYTIRVANAGPSDAAELTVTDALAAGLVFGSAGQDGVHSEGMVTWEIASLAAGESVELTLVVSLAADLAAGTQLSNVAVVSSPDDPDGPKESDPAVVTVENAAKLSVTKTASSSTALAGGDLEYTIRVANAGPSDAAELTVTDALAAGLVFGSAGQGGVHSEGLVTWKIASLAAGESVELTLVVSLAADLAAGTQLSNVAVVSSPDDPDGPKESDPAVVTVQDPRPLAISKLPSIEEAKVGQGYSYVITVSNTSLVTLEQVLVQDRLPLGLSFVAASGAGEFEDGVVSWLVPSLAAGESMALQLQVVVNGDAVVGQVIHNVATVSVDAGLGSPQESDRGNGVLIIADPDGEPEPAQTSLSLTKTADLQSVALGGMVTYTISVVNTGTSPAYDLVLTDSIPLGTLPIQTTPQGDVGEKAVTWTRGSLDPGAVWEVEIQLMVTDAGVPLVNWVFASGRNFPPVRSSSAPIQIEAAQNEVDLRVQKEVSASLVNLGAEFEYKITLQNNSASTANAVVVTDVLSPLVRLVDVSASSGSASYDSENHTVTWTLETMSANSSQFLTIKVVALSAGLVSNTAQVSSEDLETEPMDNTDTVSHTQMEFEIPNAITPNGDGVNDTWVIKGLREFFATNKVTIVNRWGVEVYKSSNYQNDWSGGNLNGGTYFYQLEVRDSSGKEHTFTGFITLIK
ncbi:DUF11 domain-containing protein, partial [Algoriphagus sp. H41]